MHDPELIWRLGAWIARRESGAAHLVWDGGDVVIRIREGRLRSIEGLDASEIARRLEVETTGQEDLLSEAHALAEARGIPETQAIGTAKEVLQQAIHGWLLDPERELELVDGEPDGNDGPGISITHALVELVLSDVEQGVADSILPGRDVLLRRVPKFLELYAPLRLSEDADLVVAKISGERTVEEVASGSSHGEQEVIRLLAALVATGMLEVVPVAASVDDVDIMPTEFPDDPAPARRLPIGLIVAAVVVVAIVLGIFGYRAVRPPKVTEKPPTVEVAAEGFHWVVVVDMGCEPEELQRILRKSREQPENLRPLAADQGTDDPCWRLAWGNYATKEAAEQAIPKIPDAVTLKDFEPHAIEIPDNATSVNADLVQD